MASEMNRQRQEEQEAVRTTIVGGRPPGCGKGVGNVPRGIEVLIKKAAVDAEFKSLLLCKRGQAARSIGLELSPSESMMLSAVPAAQLQSIIAATTVPQTHMPAFLGKVAAVMLAALGIVQGGCDDRSTEPAGTGPKDNPKDNVAATSRPAKSADDRPFTILGLVAVKPMTQPATQLTEVAGIRPANSPGIAGERIDRPSTPATEAADDQSRREVAVFGLLIDRPQDKAIRGIRVDKPQASPPTQPATQPATEPLSPAPTVFGFISDRPAVIKGIRVDRPDTPTTAPATNPATKPAAESTPLPGPDFPVAIDGIRPDRPRRTD